MKNTILFFLICFFFSCSPPQHKNKIELNFNEEIKDFIVNKIIETDTWGEEIKRGDYYFSKKEEQDDVYSYIYECNDTSYGVTCGIEISIFKKYIIGDINNDGMDDILIESFIRSYRMYKYYYLIFINNSNKFNYTNIFHLNEGKIDKIKIENGKIYGEVNTYNGVEDPLCCPSLIYKITLKYSSNNVELENKRFLKRKNWERIWRKEE